MHNRIENTAENIGINKKILNISNLSLLLGNSSGFVPIHVGIPFPQDFAASKIKLSAYNDRFCNFYMCPVYRDCIGCHHCCKYQ